MALTAVKAVTTGRNAEVSVSGQGAGILVTPNALLADYKVIFNDNGEAFISGNYLYRSENANDGELILKMPVGKIRDVVNSHYYLVNWTDTAIVAELLKTEKLKDLGRGATAKIYTAGRREFDELEILIIWDEIFKSEGKKDWNTVIRKKTPVAPDDTKQPESPFNPASVNYDPGKPVFAYDPDNGYILYSNGEIKWINTDGYYNGSVNGIVINYDKAGGLVTFKNGAVLNLKTLELKTVNAETGAAETVTVKTVDPWYKIIAKKVLSDTTTQIIILVVLALILYLKAQHDAK
jgi:hypothetical protein